MYILTPGYRFSKEIIHINDKTLITKGIDPKINLQFATQAQLEVLFNRNHPAVKKLKEQTTKVPAIKVEV